jgi:hypothetical protein
MTDKDTKEKPVSEEELTAYEKMVADRLDSLKKAFDEFPYDGEQSQKMPAFVMLHVAQLYARLDILLDDTLKFDKELLAIKEKIKTGLGV